MATDAVTVSPTINGDSVPLTAGMIVRLKPGANNNVVRAQADSAPHVQGVNGVVISGAGAPGTSVLVACIGRQTVQMESGLTPAVGDTVYVSSTVAGKGTNIIPGIVLPIGPIADVSNYVTSKTVEVDVIASSSEAGAGGTFPGFGGAPPSVSAASSAGVAGTAARSDHTHGSTVADWGTAGSVRYFACDGTNGNDANAGYSDVSQAAAGLVAVKTITQLLQIIPKFGMGRKFRAAIRSGNYASDATIDFSNISGYARMLFVATDTIPSAGAVAFAGDTNDTIAAGMTTATGMNAAGYNPTVYAVAGDGTPTITLQLAGGGAPAFPAVPGRPYLCRLRFDVATTTGALQNTAYSVVFTSGGNVLTLSQALPVNPVAGDVCYIEMPNVTGPAVTTIGESGEPVGPLTICGIQLGSLASTGGAITLSGSECASGGLQNPYLISTGQVLNVPSGNLTVGTGLRSTGLQIFGGIVTMRDGGDASTGQPLLFQGCSSILWERSAAGGLVCYGGTQAIGNNVPLTIGTNSSSGHGAACQIWGVVTSGRVAGVMPAGLICYGGYQLGRIKFSGMGANPCARIGGVGLGVTIQGLSGGVADGNTDVGVDMSPNGLSGNTLGGMGCTIALPGTPTVTGTLGDVRLPDGTIVSWASLVATPTIDSCGNIYVSINGVTTNLSFPGTGGAALSIGVYRTALVDLTTPATYAINMPVVPGKKFYIAATGRLEVATRDAAVTTGLTYSFQQNGVDVTGLTGIPISTAQLNSFAPPETISSAPGGNAPVFDLSSFPIQFKITTGVAGAGLTTCTGRLAVIGYYA